MTDVTPLDATLLPPRQLFRFSVDVLHCDGLDGKKAAALDPAYRLPVFSALDGETPWADVRMAWSEQGLAWRLVVDGKTQAPWCRESRLDESDGLQVWVDTRATLNVHRASRFCTRLAFLPCGAGRQDAEPVADQLLINRARENARPVRPGELQVASQVTKKGYELSAFAPAETLQGFDPAQQPRLGFTYAVLDRQRGLQTFSTGAAFPYEEDPSCWAELHLSGRPSSA